MEDKDRTSTCKGHLLLVDDEDNLLNGLAEFFQEQDYHVDTATNGRTVYCSSGTTRSSTLWAQSTQRTSGKDLSLFSGACATSIRQQ